MSKPPIVVKVEEGKRSLRKTQEKSFVKHVSKMRSLVSFAVLSLGGTALILAWPIALMLADSRKIPEILDSRLEILNSVSQNYIRFSIVATCAWNAFLAAHFVVQLLPWLIKHAIILIFGYCNEITSEKIESIPSVHFAIVRLATFVVTDIVYFIFFNRMHLIPAWQTIANILLVLTIFSLFLLVQRIAMVKLARNFHAVAAKERLIANKQAISVIDRLTRAVRTIGIIDLPIAIAMAAAKKKRFRNSASHTKYDIDDVSDSTGTDTENTRHEGGHEEVGLGQHDEVYCN
jgi:hypothetical protein